MMIIMEFRHFKEFPELPELLSSPKNIKYGTVIGRQGVGLAD